MYIGVPSSYLAKMVRWRIVESGRRQFFAGSNRREGK